MHFGVVKKILPFHKKFTFRIYTCWKRISKNVTQMSRYNKFSLFVYIYIYMFEMHFLIEKTCPCTQKDHFSYIYMLQTHFLGLKMLKK